VIISLGESFADLILALGEFDSIPNPPYLVLTFVVIYAVWAIYFRTVLPPGIPHGAGRVRAWLGAHYVLIFGFIGTAAGFSALTIVPLDDASAALASFRLPLPLLYVMVGFILLTWIAGASDRSFLLVHIAAAVLLLGVTALSIFVIVDRPITMGALAAAIVVADVAVVAWIGRRTRQRLPVQAT
jgi:low temperature requirement protein LtrA